MSPEERELLNKSVALTEDSNKLLHAMVRGMRVQRIMTIIYWLFILGSALGAYYVVQPYLGQFLSVYSSTGDVLNTLQ